MNSISIAKMIMYSIRAPPPPCRAARQRKAEEPSDETRSCLFFMVMGYLSFVNIYVPAPAKRASLLFLFFLKKEPKKSPEAGPAGPGSGLRPRKGPAFHPERGAFSHPPPFEKGGRKLCFAGRVPPGPTVPRLRQSPDNPGRRPRRRSSRPRTSCRTPRGAPRDRSPRPSRGPC